MAPIDKELIDKKLLNKKEIVWINHYHKKVFNNLKKYIEKVRSKILEAFNYLKFHSNPFQI